MFFLSNPVRIRKAWLVLSIYRHELPEPSFVCCCSYATTLKELEAVTVACARIIQPHWSRNSLGKRPREHRDASASGFKDRGSIRYRKSVQAWINELELVKQLRPAANTENRKTHTPSMVSCEPTACWGPGRPWAALSIGYPHSELSCSGFTGA